MPNSQFALHGKRPSLIHGLCAFLHLIHGLCALFRPLLTQGALKGTNLRGQTEPKRRFSMIFADSRLFLENKAFGQRRFSQKTADFRRKPQKTGGTRRKPQIGVFPLRFALDTCLNSPLFSSLSVHGLHFTVSQRALRDI